MVHISSISHHIVSSECDALNFIWSMPSEKGKASFVRAPYGRHFCDQKIHYVQEPGGKLMAARTASVGLCQLKGSYWILYGDMSSNLLLVNFSNFSRGAVASLTSWIVISDGYSWQPTKLGRENFFFSARRTCKDSLEEGDWTHRSSIITQKLLLISKFLTKLAQQFCCKKPMKLLFSSNNQYFASCICSLVRRMVITLKTLQVFK